MTARRSYLALLWVALFSFMDRNSQRAWAYYHIPADRVVEIGSQIDV